MPVFYLERIFWLDVTALKGPAGSVSAVSIVETDIVVRARAFDTVADPVVFLIFSSHFMSSEIIPLPDVYSHVVCLS